MPVLKKEIELNDGTKIMVRQASGLDKIRIEALQAQTFRKFRKHGLDPSEWSEEVQEEFADALTEAGAGVHDQIADWIPKCILTEDFDPMTLTSEELQEILRFVRGDSDVAEGAAPLG
tara:strand:- start:12329 stop:12682 length:354 start_codon:yes stop_codon:yes gene_type:complete